ncbi:MAG: biopolymer transporter ExbD [Candidatus Methylomirabilis oxygeniifera]|uniref:Biopolymer transport protein ExbD/TolR n=1 Tax=Methylomirabilis oxygeniifera TaxID=671143 RepID=D5MGT3_METO1|nr:MAG: biopolymer transporter ExbD [Candidatus Methylomirabilis oxyfera]CBE68964.1 Biopolymer transport protein ExbD/TolR [Candidatus Methylomirabilis oxyfera]
MKLLQRPPKKARIEIIPLIDTIFFLLVFFMMASLSMAVYRGVPVNLPKAASGQREVKENAALTVTKDGELFLDKQPIAWDALPNRLTALMTANPELTVIINADEDVPHGRVVEAMDVARGAGVGRMAIAVKPTEARRRP